MRAYTCMSFCNNPPFFPLDCSKHINSFSCICRINAKANCNCLFTYFWYPIGTKKIQFCVLSPNPPKPYKNYASVV